MALFRSPFTGGDKSYYEPSPRLWPHATPVGEKLFMWGGQILDWSSESRRRLASVVETYDPYQKQWEQHPTSGTPPVGQCNGACASLLDSLYSYGGIHGFTLHGGLYHLNTSSMSWSEVEVRNASEGPMKKNGCRMVAYRGDKLLLVGGYGIPTTDPQSGARFHRDTDDPDGKGWTNEVHLFHLQEGVWTSPASTGTRPPPCAFFSLTSIDAKRAVFFGGRQAHGRVDDVYILDLEAMHWTKVDKSGGGPWPVGRSAHAACCINYGQRHPQLLVTGGQDKDTLVLGDAWLLDVDSATWKELVLPAELPRRICHAVTAFSLAPGLTEVTVFGETRIGETTILQLESIETPPSTQEWVLVGVATKGQLGSTERLREKMVKMHQRATMAEERKAGRGGRTRGEELQERVTVAEDRAQQAERQSQELQLQIQATARRAQEQATRSARAVAEANLRAQQMEQAAHDAENGAQQAHVTAQHEVTRAQQAEVRAHQLEVRVQQAEARAAEAEERLQQEQPFWVVQRDEIQLTNESLGEGGWGAVHVANFRGLRVAAKCLHSIIASDYTRDLFIREMTMAARVRHPNLLQFIGATMVGELIILTELMPTSLRAQLERGGLPRHQIISISLDVTRALNYLHLMRPDAIIHRDISSANVLLEPGPNNSQRAKLSDYGSANFLQQLRTVGPGNPTYASPEAYIPHLQSPKMDIFSFGILLVEMCTARFPVASTRQRLIQSIADHRLVDLIRECVAEDRDNRPPATEIIVRLTEMQS